MSSPNKKLKKKKKKKKKGKLAGMPIDPLGTPIDSLQQPPHGASLWPVSEVLRVILTVLEKYGLKHSSACFF